MLCVKFMVLVGLLGAGNAVDPLPTIEVTPILHEEEATPGIAGGVVEFLFAPQIDLAGNVLVRGFYSLPPFPQLFDAVWYGPPGALELVLRHGMPAFDMPEGITISFLDDPWLAENGTIGLTVTVEGEGIVQNVNDCVIFAGRLGSIRKVLQSGDPAPGLDDGTLIGTQNFGMEPALSDNGTMKTRLWLVGPNVDESNETGFWVGPPDDLRMVWRRGMAAPGAPPGSVFAFAGLEAFNDAGELSFIGGLEGPLIMDPDDNGRWVAIEGEIRAFTAPEMPVPEIGEGVSIRRGGAGNDNQTHRGTISDIAFLNGPGIEEINDRVLLTGRPDDLLVVAREGDFAWDVENGVTFSSVGGLNVNAQDEIILRTRLTGPSITTENEWAIYFGGLDAPSLQLRDGDPAPGFDDGIVLSGVGFVPAITSMNDCGGIVAGTEIEGPGIDETTRVVVLGKDPVRDGWFPFLRAGDEIGSRRIQWNSDIDLISAYHDMTGGSDGKKQSLNDFGLHVLRIEFTDDSHGVYMLRPRWMGDGDFDGDSDFHDFAVFQRCAGMSENLSAECQAFDLDGDGVVGLTDFSSFLGQTTGPFYCEWR